MSYNEFGSMKRDGSTEYAMKRSMQKGGEKSNTNGGRVYKEDFKKEGTECPSDFGMSCGS